MTEPDFSAFRDEFSVTDSRAYFKAPAVTALPDAARRAVERFAGDMVDRGCLNESDWIRRTDETRELAAGLVGVDPDRVAFVPGTSAGLSMIAEGLPLESGDRVAVPEGEFPSNVFPWLNQEHRGVEVDRIPTGQDGSIELDAIRSTLEDRTRVLALSSVQFHNGFRTPLDELEELVRPDRYLVVDGIQSVGWDDLRLDRSPVDGLVADAHKWMCGPEGIGIMYLSPRLQEVLHPVLVGWKSVKDAFQFEETFRLRDDAARFEPGSSNHLGIHALYASLRLLADHPMKEIKRRCLELRSEAARMLSTRGFEVLGADWDRRHRSPILAARPPGDARPEDLAGMLAERRVDVSARRGCLRAGFHAYNNEADLGRWMDALDEVL